MLTAVLANKGLVMGSLRWKLLFVAGIFLQIGNLFAQDQAELTDLAQRLKAIDGVVSVEPTRNDERHFSESYVVMFSQPVDHAQPDGATFTQRVFVSHAGYDKLVLLGTEGYSCRGNHGGELQQILGGNQISVEHRFFGESVPEPKDWSCLTVKQSADDLHAIVTAFKGLYPGKWVSSGRSKGGQTALFYKCHYPDDMDAVVAYVAPVNLAQEDPRMARFPQVAGDAATRQKIEAYQLALLQREDEILPLIQKEAEEKNWTFAMGLVAGYEYGVLEYPYAFWQGGGIDADKIPAPDAPVEDLVSHYQQVGAMYYYSDKGKRYFEPFMYQAFTEIGYYNYDITAFKPYLKALENPTNLTLCPEGVEIAFNPATMYFVNHFLQYQADHVIYIYGELDAWSATQMQLIGRTDALKYIVAGAHHGAGVRSFSPEQQVSFYENMERWLGPLNRL